MSIEKIVMGQQMSLIYLLQLLCALAYALHLDDTISMNVRRRCYVIQMVRLRQATE